MNRYAISLMENQAGSVSRNPKKPYKYSLQLKLMPELQEYGVIKILLVYGRELFNCMDCLKVRALVNTMYSDAQEKDLSDTSLLVEMSIYIALDIRADLALLVEYWQSLEEDATETFFALYWIIHWKRHKIGRARRLVEREKNWYSKRYRKNGMIARGEWLSLPNVLESDRNAILGGRRSDGLFRGNANMAWVVSDNEQQALLALEYRRSLTEETQLHSLRRTVLLLPDGKLKLSRNKGLWACECDSGLKTSLSDAVSYIKNLSGSRRYGIARMV